MSRLPIVKNVAKRFLTLRIFSLLVLLFIIIAGIEVYFSPGSSTLAFYSNFAQFVFTRNYTSLSKSYPSGMTSQVRMYGKHVSLKATAVNFRSIIAKSSYCVFSETNPFHKEIYSRIDKRYRSLNCSEGLPTIVYFDHETNELYVNMTKSNQTIGHVDFCRYSPLTLQDVNDSTLSKKIWSAKFLSSPMKVNDTDEFIKVECYTKSKLVSEMFKARIIKKPDVEKKREADYKHHVKEHSPVETMSILIVGMDGMAKQNLIRAMPKTRTFIIEELNAKELNKFNKLGDNTFPNMIPLHTGMLESEFKVKTKWTRKTYFDESEDVFLWHDYQMAGYRTLMNLDVTGTTAFHYLKKGWKHPKFDYYTRPLALEIERKAITHKHGGNCVGDIPELHILQDYILQMTFLFNNTKNKPYFMHNFFTALTHNLQRKATQGDDIYLNFFRQLKQKNVLNNTVVIFFSDHGARFGGYRRTFNGKIEINTPFMFFMFPPWFEDKYPKLMETFSINQDRLTSFFDIHATLKSMLTFTGKSEKGDLNNRGISLFDEIPLERTCGKAGIPMEFCNCNSVVRDAVIPTDVSKTIVSYVLDTINIYLTIFKHICAELSLKSIHSVYLLNTNSPVVRSNLKAYYQATFETKPGGALFEAILSYNKSTREVSLKGDIIRLNMYKGQDWCMNKIRLKSFCFCKS